MKRLGVEAERDTDSILLTFDSERAEEGDLLQYRSRIERVRNAQVD